MNTELKKYLIHRIEYGLPIHRGHLKHLQLKKRARKMFNDLLNPYGITTGHTVSQMVESVLHKGKIPLLSARIINITNE